MGNKFIHIERRRDGRTGGQTLRHQLSNLEIYLRKLVKIIKKTQLLRKCRRFVPHLYLTTHWNHMWPSYEETHTNTMTDQLWKIWQIAKFVQQLCLKKCNSPGGTSGVVFMNQTVLYNVRLTLLTSPHRHPNNSQSPTVVIFTIIRQPMILLSLL